MSPTDVGDSATVADAMDRSWVRVQFNPGHAVGKSTPGWLLAHAMGAIASLHEWIIAGSCVASPHSFATISALQYHSGLGQVLLPASYTQQPPPLAAHAQALLQSEAAVASHVAP
jgi:hypothetical protein